MPLLTVLVLLVLAAGRITRLWDDELLVGFRARWENLFPPTPERAKIRFVKHPQFGGLVAVPSPLPHRVRLIGRLAACAACRSVWVAGALVAVVWAGHGLALPLLIWPAVAEGARWLATR